METIEIGRTAIGTVEFYDGEILPITGLGSSGTTFECHPDECMVFPTDGHFAILRALEGQFILLDNNVCRPTKDIKRVSWVFEDVTPLK